MPKKNGKLKVDQEVVDRFNNLETRDDLISCWKDCLLNKAWARARAFPAVLSLPVQVELQRTVKKQIIQQEERKMSVKADSV